MSGFNLNRREVVSELLSDRGKLLVISGLGSPSYDVMAAGDNDRNFYLWGAMGGAAMMGLGLAMAKPDESVLVLTGDGEMLMALGALATIAVKAPKNLAIIVLDNGHYGETGMQLSHAGNGVELDKVAASVGFDWTTSITEADQLNDLKTRIHANAGLTFATIKIGIDEEEKVLPPRDGVYIKNRVRMSLGQVIN